MTVQRFVSLGLDADAELPDEIPAPSLSVNEASVDTARIALKLKSSARPILALCPGAEFGEAKRWPEEHYATIAGYWNRLGWQVWLFGSEKDRPVCERIISLSQIPAQNLAGRTTLEQAIDLLSLAEMVVSNDSGLMHIAAALERPTVAVYGSSDPSFTPPLSKNSQVVRLGLDCSPCFKRECPLGHLDCLKELSPDLVLAAMNKII
jgi:heptosyltransferase-2